MPKDNGKLITPPPPRRAAEGLFMERLMELYIYNKQLDWRNDPVQAVNAVSLLNLILADIQEG